MDQETRTEMRQFVEPYMDKASVNDLEEFKVAVGKFFSKMMEDQMNGKDGHEEHGMS
jgi:hypothetical protein